MAQRFKHGARRPPLIRRLAHCAAVLLAFAAMSLNAAANAPEIQEAAALEQRAHDLTYAGKPKEARPLAERALALREKYLGPEHADTATTLNTLGEACTDLGDFPRAEECFRRALALREKLFPEPHADTALSLSNLADLHFKRGEYSRADPLNRRALAMRSALAGADSMEAAKSWNNLGAQLLQSGDLPGAEEAFSRVVQICAAQGKAESSLASVGLGNLALIKERAGDLAGSRVMQARALALREKLSGANNEGVLVSVNNLAVLDYLLGDFSSAEAGWRRVLAARQRALGTEHPDTLRVRFHLATIDAEHRDRDAGLAQMREIVPAYEKAVGPDAPQTSRARGAFAAVLLERGLPAEAEAQARLAVTSEANTLAPGQVDRRSAQSTLARALLALDRSDEARAVGQAVQAEQEAAARAVFSFAPEDLRLAFQREGDPYGLAISLHDPEQLLRAVLRNKAVVLDTLLEDRRAARAAQTAGDRDELDRLIFLRRRWSRLEDQTPPPSEVVEKRAAHERELAALTQEIEAIESRLARRIGGSGGARRALTIEPADIRAALPRRGILIEFIRYAAKSSGDPRAAAGFGALLVPPSGAVRWVPLGEAASLEAAVGRWNAAVRRSDARRDLECEAALAALRDLVWKPLIASIPTETEEMVLAPDGALNFVPFAVLPEGAGFLAERFRLRIVATGRDLCRPARDPAGSRRRLVVFANPNLTSSSAANGKYAALRFPPLPGSAKEASAILTSAKATGWETELYDGAEASKDRLLALAAPRVLHLATHGFFLSPDPAAGGRANAMQRSGLALSAAGGTGIVTAEDVSGLDLRGTWLVTVSACESGAGDVQAGEGVLGLRRGFALAGARDLVLTLWPVEDEAASAFMRAFVPPALESGDASGAFISAQRAELLRLRRTVGAMAAARLAGGFVLSEP